MDQETRVYRGNINRMLEPVKVMLVNKRQQISYADWLLFVRRTKTSIIAHPDQYIGSEIPGQDALAAIIESIFSDFLDDQNSRMSSADQDRQKSLPTPEIVDPQEQS